MALGEFDEKTIFQLARKLESPGLREDFLRQACGDDEELCTRVQALLDVLEKEKAFYHLLPHPSRPPRNRLGHFVGVVQGAVAAEPAGERRIEQMAGIGRAHREQHAR